MVDISIIIRCKNEGKAIGATLEKVFAQEVAGIFEVIIVDSGSTDRTLAIAGNYPARVFQIPPEDFSFGYALNYGIEKAEGRIIVNLSAHCLPADNNWLSELTAPLTEGRADAVYGRQIPVAGINPYEEVAFAKHFPEGEKKSGRVPFSNANCAFLKEMWTELNFDEELPSWEDYYWYLKHKDSRRFLYCAPAAVYHTHPFSMRSTRQRAYNDGVAFGLFERGHNIDLINRDYPTGMSRVRLVINDIISHMIFFGRKGYVRHVLFAPFVRLLVYKAYRDGYRSALKQCHTVGAVS